MRDDKVLTGWNGLMIAAYADGYRVLKVEKYRHAAEAAAEFLLRRLRTPDGRLLRTYRLGQAKLPAYLEDYAFLAHGLLRLHAATGDARWLREARALADRMIADFEDREDGGFFFTAVGHESLLARPKDPFDNALPSGNSMAILDLLALHRATGESSYRDHAARALRAFATPMARLPYAMPMMLVGLEQYLDQEAKRDRPAPAPPVADSADGSPRTVTASARPAGDAADGHCRRQGVRRVGLRVDRSRLAPLRQSRRGRRAQAHDPRARSVLGGIRHAGRGQVPGRRGQGPRFHRAGKGRAV